MAMRIRGRTLPRSAACGRQKEAAKRLRRPARIDPEELDELFERTDKADRRLRDQKVWDDRYW